jgi:hypothetical protein
MPPEREKGPPFLFPPHPRKDRLFGHPGGDEVGMNIPQQRAEIPLLGELHIAQQGRTIQFLGQPHLLTGEVFVSVDHTDLVDFTSYPLI